MRSGRTRDLAKMHDSKWFKLEYCVLPGINQDILSLILGQMMLKHGAAKLGERAPTGQMEQIAQAWLDASPGSGA